MKKSPIVIALVAVFLINSRTAIFAQANEIGSGVAISLPGSTGSRIDLGNYFNDLNFPVTVEAWVFPTAWTPGGYSPIFSTDNVGFGGSYYGFWVRFNSSGNLIFEIGDGSGSGGDDRRGKRTTSNVPLNEWTHVSVVASSVSDIKFYFNGVLQTVVSTDGTATNSSILHTSYPAYIGAQITPSAEHDFTGKIDEIRLWNVAKVQTDLQDKMCEKLSGVETGLIGNWRFDENYLGLTVEDYSVTGVDGNVIGSASKVTSGAPIGNVSTYVYTTDYTGVSLNLTSAGGDKFKVNKVANNPHGIHLYRVDDQPYFTTGLLATPAYYYGVFSADNGTDAKYTITYTYSFGNGVVNIDNEADAHIFKRIDNSITSWSPQPASIDTALNRLTKKNITGRFEFVFSVDSVNANGGAKLIGELQQFGNQELIVYPNPTSTNTTFANLMIGVEFAIVDMQGRIIYHYTATDTQMQIDLSVLSPGLYVVMQKVNSAWNYAQFQKL